MIVGNEAQHGFVEEGVDEFGMVRQNVDPARGARVTFEGEDLAVGRLHEVEGDLAREVCRFDEFCDPVKCFGVMGVLKGDGRARACGEFRKIRRVRGDVSVVADAVRADLPSLHVFLRDPG